MRCVEGDVPERLSPGTFNVRQPCQRPPYQLRCLWPGRLVMVTRVSL
jgi:hypothetical protein